VKLMTLQAPGLGAWLSRYVCLQEAEDEAMLRQFEFLSIDQPGRGAPRVVQQRKRRVLICELAPADYNWHQDTCFGMRCQTTC
jgi:hypothetical protein